MTTSQSSLTIARLVAPRAIKAYAQALGWKRVDDVNGDVALYHHPTSDARQLLIPLESKFDDFADRMMEAVQRLAEFEDVPTGEVLDHLLLPPADILRFRDISPDTESGTLPLEQAVNQIQGTRKLLLAVAHSELASVPFHPRMARGEAEEFVARCRMGQTERGSFTISLACPLEPMPVPGMESYARRVTAGLIDVLRNLANAVDAGYLEKLAGAARPALLSANLCEALMLMRPVGDRSLLTVSSVWSKALPYENGIRRSEIKLQQETFEAAEYLAPIFRSASEPTPDKFVGFVDVLRGQPGSDGRPQGEVLFRIFVSEDDIIRARALLTAEQYATAGRAHLANEMVVFDAILTRASRSSRLDNISNLGPLDRPADAQRYMQLPE